MARMRDRSSEQLSRFAVEDFGTAQVPIELRRQARLEADKRGITPKEALGQILARRAGGSINRRSCPIGEHSSPSTVGYPSPRRLPKALTTNSALTDPRPDAPRAASSARLA